MQDVRSPAQRVRHYRRRAEELRTIAGEWADSGIRGALIGVARNYEHMAEQLEKQLPQSRRDKNTSAQPRGH